MNLHSLSILLAFGLMTGACGKNAEPVAETAPPLAATTQAEPDPTASANAADTSATAAATADTAATSVVAAAPAEDWLIWSRDGKGWVTRWVSVTGDDFTVVAQRKAVVVSDGTKLTRIERDDTTVDVSPCICVEEDDSPDCKVIGKVTLPGLRAYDLAGGPAVAVYKGGDNATMGGDFSFGVDLAGGSGSLVFVDWFESGYFCGAHGLSEGGTLPVDVSKGDAQPKGLFAAVDKKLPVAVRTVAMKELYTPLKECEDEDMTEADALKLMGLSGVSVRLDEAGEPKIHWGFTADVMYVCSADYGVHGAAVTPLIKEAADLGLAGPLPVGVKKALAAAPEKGTVGWSKLSLTGEARDAALKAFQAAPEPVWGPTHFGETLDPVEAPKGDTANASALVSAARKLSAKKDYEGAIAKFTAAIAADGKLAEAYSGRGYASLRAGHHDAAKADFDMALTLNDAPVYQAQVLYNLGQLAEMRSDKPAAKAAYAQSVKLRPNDVVQKALKRVSE